MFFHDKYDWAPISLAYILVFACETLCVWAIWFRASFGILGFYGITDTHDILPRLTMRENRFERLLFFSTVIVVFFQLLLEIRRPVF